MHKTIHKTHVNKAQNLIYLIKHVLKTNTKAFTIKWTFTAYTNTKFGGFSVAFPADF